MGRAAISIGPPGQRGEIGATCYRAGPGILGIAPATRTRERPDGLAIRRGLAWG
jgi:hypothetical protein